MTLDGFAVVLDDGRLGFITPTANRFSTEVRSSGKVQISDLLQESSFTCMNLYEVSKGIMWWGGKLIWL